MNKIIEVEKRTKKVIVVESNFIIGTHIKVLLENDGHNVFSDIVRVDDLEVRCRAFQAEVIIINKKLFYRHQEELMNIFKGMETIRFIVLFALTPGRTPEFCYSKIDYVEKPFMGFEIKDLLAA